MGRFSVLIVDDQREVARLVRVGLEETLGQALEVRDVPSGEEALLELSLRPADLLIVDLGLPGLGGRELISKVHQAHPHTRFLVLTGWDEGSARRAVRNLPVQEVLLKPVNIETLVDAVREALGLPAGEADAEATDEGALSYEESRQRLADLLAEAREQAAVDAVLLLDDEGRILLRSPGPLPPDLMEDLRRPLVYLHSAGLDLARTLRQPLPEHLFFFQGPTRAYGLSSVAPYYMLLWIRAHTADQAPLTAQAEAIRRTVAGVREILERMGILDSAHAGALDQAREAEPHAAEMALEPEALAQDAEETVDLEADDQVAALLESLGEWNPDQAGVDPDAFWQEAASAKDTDLLHTNADALSYEEARRLGLVPDDSAPPDA